MRVCVLKSNNRLLEMQSDARAGTLTANALLAGFAQSEIEEREVTQQEYEALMAAQPKTPAEIRAEGINIAINNDAVLAILKTMSNDELDAWFNSTITDLASARNMLRRIFKMVIRR